jgi:hypothetical protein
LNLTISAGAQSVSLRLRGEGPAGSVLLQLPSFAGNIASASNGIIDRRTGTVTLNPGARRITIELRHPLGSSPTG